MSILRRALLAGAALAAAGPGCTYPEIGTVGPSKSGGHYSVAPSKDAGDDELVEIPADPGTPDGGASPACALAAPFGAPRLVPGIAPDVHASTPRLTSDELALYFTGYDPAASTQIMRATRPSRAQPFGPATAVPNINSDVNDNDPSLSADGLTIVFHSGRSGNNDVWFATRESTAGEFGSAMSAPGIATDAYEGQGFFHAPALELWFVSDRDGGYDFFRATLGDGVFGPATPVAELNSPEADLLPSLSGDGRTLFFSSTREGTKGGQDLFLATRPAPGAAFGAPVPIDELNTGVDEQAGFLSPDGCRVYFSRAGGAGGQQLFVAERSPSP